MTDLNVKAVGDFLHGNLHRLFPVGSISMTKNCNNLQNRSICLLRDIDEITKIVLVTPVAAD